MITVGTLEAKNRLSELLDRVEKGERVQITRHGKVVATLVGDEQAKQERASRAMEDIRAIREKIRADISKRGDPPITTDEILDWIREGRR
ncbi:type II toxin-antitoxin system prevent-host-death family antitoxin [Terrarubrum flagellatum]|uniref:type II toxin-antitoxin system Phd/YefM family antitoxin n=1 Tax=Terrirubrum flagellatum TaxID=2895980 RepID=UPI003144DFF2